MKVLSLRWMFSRFLACLLPGLLGACSASGSVTGDNPAQNADNTLSAAEATPPRVQDTESPEGPGGPSPQADPCLGQLCSGHGQCVVTGQTASCQCDPGYHVEATHCVADSIQSGPGPFRHPGVAVNREQLGLLKAKVAAGEQPWKAAFDKAKTTRYGSLTYTFRPHEIVECGPYSNPDQGCTQEKDDAIAAYTHALLWNITGAEAHAKKATQIMDGWSAVLKDHTNTNAPLQAAWCAALFARAAEIIRHTYAGWSPEAIGRFEDMLERVFLPQVINGRKTGGNWELSMIEAIVNIGVFVDSREIFDRGVSMWRGTVPAYIYLTSDGELPASPPRGPLLTKEQLIAHWSNQKTFVDGLCQETCRDFGHTGMGLGAMTGAAETARIQGVNLYAEEAKRITAAFEFHARYLNGEAAPSWLCGGQLDLGFAPTWEVGYNNYANRNHMPLPHTKILIENHRPTGTSQHMAWETLTHAEVGSVGLH